MSVRVRFAPSPTGYLHIGNVRVAIANYIFAKQNDGEFLLRIDDTDETRSSKEFEDGLYEDLGWLGLPNKCYTRQSERIGLYNDAFEQLKTAGLIYECFETPEELAVTRKVQLMNKMPPLYNRAALNLSEEQKDAYRSEGRKSYWRFHLSDSTAEWEDLITGTNIIDLRSLSDPVIRKPDGGYVYTFASVVDDAEMRISHIIRGADHTSNTGVQIAIFQALNAKLPTFAHLPLVSSSDGSDISKRSGSAYSIRTLRENGAEPFAIIATLTSLGSSYDYTAGDKMRNVIDSLNFNKISVSSPKFDINLIYQNTKKVLRSYEFSDVEGRLSAILPDLSNEKKEPFWNAVRGNLDRFEDVRIWYDVCYKDDVKYVSDKNDLAAAMLEGISSNFTWDDWLAFVKNAVPYRGRELMHEIRMIFSGLDNGPDLKTLYDVIDRDLLRGRIKRSL